MRLNKSRLAVLAAVAALIAGCSTGAANNSPSSKSGNDYNLDVAKPLATTAQVLEAVRAAQTLSVVPDAVAAGLAHQDDALPKQQFDCKPIPSDTNPANATLFGQCAWGDAKGSKLMVVYGDSHSKMWTPGLAAVAAKNGWKLRVFSQGSCPVPDLPFLSYQTNAPNTLCDSFRNSAIPAIRALHPDLIVLTSISIQTLADNTRPTPDQWSNGWTSTVQKLTQPGTKFALLGDIPEWENDGARCLSIHLKAVQDCSAPVAEAKGANVQGEEAAAARAGVLYIPTTPWICGERCQPIIADTRVYTTTWHLSTSYVVYLAGALSEALQPVMT